MSNTLAIATVSATLQQLLLNEVSKTQPGTKVTIGMPASPGTTNTINICLYQVGLNAAYRNHALPMRNSQGKLIQQPQIGLDLYYVLSFYGDEQRLETQRLLGATVQALNIYSVLTKEQINLTIAQSLYDFLADSDLADEPVEQIKFTPTFANGEGEGGATAMWSIFFKDVAYPLSVTYKASVVLISASEEVVQTLPVQTTTVTTTIK
jgi:hypothetical protein